MKLSEPTPRAKSRPSRLYQPNAGIHRSMANLMSLRLFALVFVSLIVCVYMPFRWWPSQVFLRLWQFSAWSPLMCSSVYLLSQKSWFIYIYKFQEVTVENYAYLKRTKKKPNLVICLHAQRRKKSDILWFTNATYSQMLWILSDMKWSQPQEIWQMPLGI